MASPPFTLIREEPLQGIDARSPENQIPPGYLRDALNTDITQGMAGGRPGYAGYAGNFPVRAVEVDYDEPNDTICFTLDSAIEAASIDLLNVRSSPLVIYGRLSGNIGAGPFTTTDSAQYYTGFFQETRQTFLTGTHTAPGLVIPGTTHGLGTSDIFVEVAESLSAANLSNRMVSWDSISIDETSNDVEIDYTNGTGSDISVFTYYANKSAVTGSVYVGPNYSVPGTGTPTTLYGGAISAATHQLSNFNIVARVYRDNGGSREVVEPDSLTVHTTNGEVTVVITNSTGVAADYFVILSAAPTANFKTGSLSVSTYTITIDNPDKPFIFPGVYTSNGSLLEQVIPDEIEFDSAANTIEITFQNPGSSSFTVYWEYATIRSTQVCVTDAALTASGVDASPQITIWGLDHTELYGDSPEARAGWANHIDSYRIAGESRVVGGQGGNLYSVREYSESATAYLYGSALPSLFQRVASATVLAPALWETGSTPGRTRGYITGTSLGDNWATCTNVEYDSVVAGGSVRYDLTIPALSLRNSAGTAITINSANLGTIISAGDQITAEGMGYSRHNGVFTIVQVEAGITANTVSFWVENPRVTTNDWDDTGISGSVGLFSDQLVLQAASPFLPNDVLLSDSLTATQQLTVVSSSDVTPTNITVSGVTEVITIQTGVQIVGRRTGSVIPLRTTADVASVANFVRGDIVEYSGESEPRPLRIEYVNPLADITGCTVTSDGVTATVTLGSGNTDHLRVGGIILLRRAGVYTGEITISDIPDQSTFTFSSAETDTVTTAVLIGQTIHIGEPMQWEDTTSDTNVVTVERRLIPIEAPDDQYMLTPSTRERYFDANSTVDQPFLRSTMVADTLFLTNGDDEVMKFDGSSLYRAGLPKWQPGVFVQTDTAATNIVTDTKTIAFLATTTDAEFDSGQARIDAAFEDAIPPGAQVKLVQGSVTLDRVVQGYKTTATATYITFAQSIGDFTNVSGAGTISERAIYRYYYRLNAVDQNQNVIASAVSQSEDYTVELTVNAGIRHKLIGFPAWDNYDYDALYVQIYRTKANTSAPFYRVHQERLTFNGADGYVEHTDSLSDSNLIDLDPINTALKGTELGIGWTEPLRATSITSAAGTAILGGIQDYPQFDIQLFGDTSNTAASDLNGTLVEFRRDITDTAGTTNMVNRVRYQLVDPATSPALVGNITSISENTGIDFTVTPATPHSLVAGDWVYLYWSTASTPSSTNRPLTYSGWWQIYSVSTTVSFTIKHTGALAGTDPDRFIRATVGKDIPVLLGEPGTNPDGNSSAATANLAGLNRGQAAKRLALAINASMRMADTTVSGQSTFTPWLMAIGGNDTGVSGRLLVRQPRVDTTSLGIRLVTLGANYRVFINDIERSTSTNVGFGAGVFSAQTTLLPSRILVGYENFPEIFDNPTALLDSDSDSAVDINPADGQEVTAIVPFFGEAAFGAAQQSSVVVVFKTASIYLVDVNEKRAGRNPVQRIETEGIGCTAPNSVSVTRNGIIFANESGIYVLRRNLAVEYIGKLMERQWERVDRDQLALAQGHHYTVGRKYKLSVPVTGDTASSEVFVYDHTNEGDGTAGSWTRYDNHPSTGWCNLDRDAFFCSSTGRIFVVRRRGDEVDYQDDHSAYTFRLQLRANDFGQSGSRKIFDSVFLGYRTEVPSEASVGTAVDTQQEYTPVTGATVVTPEGDSDGFSDPVGQDVLTVRHTTSRRKGTSISVQVETSTRLQAVEIASVEFRVAALGSGGVLEAAETGLT